MFFDSHVHTDFSHDGTSSMEEYCDKALELGLKGVAFTDHYDPVLDGGDFSHIKISVERAEKLREKYPFKILRGVELGDYFAFQKECDNCRESFDFDVVLGSVHTKHTFKMAGHPLDYHDSINWGVLRQEEIEEYFTAYYQNTLTLVRENDIDVLTHLTLPLKFLNGKYHFNITLEKYTEQIERILKEMIKRGIALEINTTCVGTEWNRLMPHKEWLALYYSLGGRRITLGSDAHAAKNLGKGLEAAAKTAKEVGFTHYCYYENRKSVEVAL